MPHKVSNNNSSWSVSGLVDRFNKEVSDVARQGAKALAEADDAIDNFMGGARDQVDTSASKAESFSSWAGDQLDGASADLKKSFPAASTTVGALLEGRVSVDVDIHIELDVARTLDTVSKKISDGAEKISQQVEKLGTGGAQTDYRKTFQEGCRVLQEGVDELMKNVDPEQFVTGPVVSGFKPSQLFEEGARALRSGARVLEQGAEVLGEIEESATQTVEDFKQAGRRLAGGAERFATNLRDAAVNRVKQGADDIVQTARDIRDGANLIGNVAKDLATEVTTGVGRELAAQGAELVQGAKQLGGIAAEFGKVAFDNSVEVLRAGGRAASQAADVMIDVITSTPQYKLGKMLGEAGAYGLREGAKFIDDAARGAKALGEELEQTVDEGVRTGIETGVRLLDDAAKAIDKGVTQIERGVETGAKMIEDGCQKLKEGAEELGRIYGEMDPYGGPLMPLMEGPSIEDIGKAVGWSIEKGGEAISYAGRVIESAGKKAEQLGEDMQHFFSQPMEEQVAQMGEELGFSRAEQKLFANAVKQEVQAAKAGIHEFVTGEPAIDGEINLTELALMIEGSFTGRNRGAAAMDLSMFLGRHGVAAATSMAEVVKNEVPPEMFTALKEMSGGVLKGAQFLDTISGPVPGPFNPLKMLSMQATAAGTAMQLAGDIPSFADAIIKHEKDMLAGLEAIKPDQIARSVSKLEINEEVKYFAGGEVSAHAGLGGLAGVEGEVTIKKEKDSFKVTIKGAGQLGVGGGKEAAGSGASLDGKAKSTGELELTCKTQEDVIALFKLANYEKIPGENLARSLQNGDFDGVSVTKATGTYGFGVEQELDPKVFEQKFGAMGGATIGYKDDGGTPCAIAEFSSKGEFELSSGGNVIKLPSDPKALRNKLENLSKDPNTENLVGMLPEDTMAAIAQATGNDLGMTFKVSAETKLGLQIPVSSDEDDGEKTKISFDHKITLESNSGAIEIATKAEIKDPVALAKRLNTDVETLKRQLQNNEVDFQALANRLGESASQHLFFETKASFIGRDVAGIETDAFKLGREHKAPPLDLFTAKYDGDFDVEKDIGGAGVDLGKGLIKKMREAFQTDPRQIENIMADAEKIQDDSRIADFLLGQISVP